MTYSNEHLQLYEGLEKVFDRYIFEGRENFTMLCPFHDEVTPSFLVHKEELIANCFGCGKSGYIDHLVAEYAGITDLEARKLLGIKLEDKLFKKQIHNYREPPRVFPESWLAPFERSVHKYVLERGFTEATIRSAGSLYDRSTQRQVFPHRSRGGELLGCAGRSCNNNEPKWLFYWGYQKGRSLYRVPSDGWTKEPTLILVEGIFDALWLYQYGYKNVAATLGTKVTPFQIKEALDKANHIVIIGDNDAAGKEFESKLYGTLHKSAQVYLCKLPAEAKDVQDLNERQLRDVVDCAETRLQRAINVHREVV